MEIFMSFDFNQISRRVHKPAITVIFENFMSLRTLAASLTTAVNKIWGDEFRPWHCY
jgi:hypothetical protein